MKKIISKVIIVLGFVALLLVPQQCFASGSSAGGSFNITVDPTTCTNPEGCEGYNDSGHIAKVENLVKTIIGWASLAVGLASVGFIIWGGVMYSAAFGDPGKIQKAKMIIISAIIGLVIALLSGFIVTVVLNGLGI
jgi:hypothetical protein